MAEERFKRLEEENAFFRKRFEELDRGRDIVAPKQEGALVPKETREDISHPLSSDLVPRDTIAQDITKQNLLM